MAGLLHADYGMIGVLALYACFFGNPWVQAAVGSGVILLGVYKLYGAGFTACLLGLTISGIYIYLIRSYNGKRGKVHGNKYLLLCLLSGTPACDRAVPYLFIGQ